MINRKVYMDKLLAYKDNVIIKVITGLRRCGKSTLLLLFRNYLLEQGVSNGNIIYINFELMEFDDIRDYKTLYNLIKGRMPKENKTYLLLDEIQQVEGWEKTINGLIVECDVDVYITGSNAYLLSSELSTLLSGRYVEIKMLPLSFKEYLSFNEMDESNDIIDKFNQFLKYGSLPAITTLPQENLIINDFLMGIYNTVILKDVVQRNSIKEPAMLDRLIRYIISNIGNIISVNKISGYLKNEAKEDKSIQNATISNYLEMLENAFILYKVNRYDIRGKEMLKSLSKYYVVDTGIRNALLGYTDTDYGHIIENVVYFELLRKGYQVFIGKWYDLEVDFVAVRQDDRKYFQVTYSMMDENVKRREIAPLKAIPDNYEKTIISMDKTFITDHEGIKFMHLIDFLLAD